MERVEGRPRPLVLPIHDLDEPCWDGERVRVVFRVDLDDRVGEQCGCPIDNGNDGFSNGSDDFSHGSDGFLAMEGMALVMEVMALAMYAR